VECLHFSSSRLCISEFESRSLTSRGFSGSLPVFGDRCGRSPEMRHQMVMLLRSGGSRETVPVRRDFSPFIAYRVFFWRSHFRKLRRHGVYFTGRNADFG
jgi:hypothetical protein